jgi:predicted RNA binding protein YcfA (HicA-like mRNA interferase family)
MNGKLVIKKLEDQGWKVLRSKGSHYQLSKGKLHTSVPVKNKELGKGLIAAIERQTGVKLT